MKTDRNHIRQVVDQADAVHLATVHARSRAFARWPTSGAWVREVKSSSSPHDEYPVAWTETEIPDGPTPRFVERWEPPK